MTSDVELDRRLTAWLEGEAAPHAPGELHARFITGMGRSRQRSGWATTERWISMETRAQLGAMPRAAIVLVIIGLLLAMAAGAIVVGGSNAAKASNGLIAYLHEGDIYTAQPDGSDRKLLVGGDGVQAGPSWSPHGDRLAYWSTSNGTGWHLLVVDADGSDPITVASEVLEVTGYQTPEWSPDGSMLAFSARTVRAGQEPCAGSSSVLGDFCSSRIFVAAADGSTGAVQVGDPEMDARTAAWSPDGSVIAFSGGHAAEGIGLYLMAPDGTDIRRVSEVSGEGWGLLRLDWSPDGSTIVGTAGAPNWDVWIFEADGSAEANISGAAPDPDVVRDEVFPSYAPDGAIAWLRRAPCDCVVLLDDGGEPMELDGFSSLPIFSPDGLVIATGSDTGRGEVAIIDREGDVVATIEAIPGGEFGGAPSWQPVTS